MFYRPITLVLVLSISVVVLSAEAGNTDVASDQSETGIQLPSKETAEYWVIRSQALTELIPYLTSKRSEFKDAYRLMTQYLDEVGTRADYFASGIKAPNTPEIYAQALGLTEKLAERGTKTPEKTLTWGQIIEVAMRFVLQEGYLPTEVSGGEELTMMKNICGQKERYGKKVHKEMRENIKKCMDIWTYVGTIDRQGDCRAYAQRIVEEERQAQEEDLARRREERTARGRQQRAQQQAYREQKDTMVRRQAMLNSRYGGYRW